MNPRPQPLVSVVTPVYNEEKHLAECIESVLAQTYPNWEYVIVNNRSTDRSLQIAQCYAAQDARIRVCDNREFLRAIPNHNHAIRQISSESKYCKVVLGDDWIFPECLTKMVELAEAHPTVAIVGAYGLRNDHVSWDGLPYASTVIPGREICRNTLLGGPYIFGSPTSLLIRSDEVRKRTTFYNEANPHCDIEACLDILTDRDLGFVHQVLTFTREQSESESAFANRFGTAYLGTLEHLTKYGRTYLSTEEYERCIRQCWEKYYAYLGCIRVFGNKEKGFWEFHRSVLGRLGYSLRMGKVATAALVEVLDLALNPLKTSKRIARKLSHFPENTTR
jgi:glycosyltransferase involved in cell wall biosynthesis